jgi:transposase
VPNTSLLGGLECVQGTNTRGGKILNSAIRPGNPHLKAILAEVVWAISHTKENYLADQYRRIARRGKQKAVVAVSHSVLVILYPVLRDKKPYNGLRADYFDQLDTKRIERHHLRLLEQLGYTVTLTPKEAA